MYKLNGTNISKKRAMELIDDLVMFPFVKKDIELEMKERKEKYINELHEHGSLRIADSLTITISE